MMLEKRAAAIRDLLWLCNMLWRGESGLKLSCVPGWHPNALRMWNVICGPRTYFGPTQHLLQFPLCWIVAGCYDFGIHVSLACECLWFRKHLSILDSNTTVTRLSWYLLSSRKNWIPIIYFWIRSPQVVSSAVSQNMKIAVIYLDFAFTRLY